MSMANREKEAEEYVSKAKKCTEKSLTQWKPKHTEGAENYEKAAKIYQSIYSNTNDIGSITSLRLASNYYEKAVKHYVKGKTATSALNVQETHANMFADAATAVAQHSEREKRKNPRYTGPGGASEANALWIMQQAVQQAEAAADLYREEVNMERCCVFTVKAADALKLFSRHLIAVGDTSKLLEDVQKSYARKMVTAIEGYSAITSTASERSTAKLATYALPDLYRGLILHFLREGHSLKGAVWAEKHALGFRHPGDSDAESDKVGEPTGMRYKEECNIFKTLGQPTNAAKAGLEVVVMCLYSPYYAAAGNMVAKTAVKPPGIAEDGITWAKEEQTYLASVTGYAQSEEESTAQALTQALADGEEELLQDAKSRHCLNFLLPDVSKMSKQLQLPGGGGGGGSGGAGGGVSAGANNAGDASEEDEDYVDLR